MQARSKIAALSTAIPIACYVLARVLELLHTPLPNTPIVALDVTSALVFAMVDGTRHYRRSGMLVFAVICLVVGNAIENLGIAAGIPFGRYRFLELMGPKMFNVPILLGLAYVGMRISPGRLPASFSAIKTQSWIVHEPVGCSAGCRLHHGRLGSRARSGVVHASAWLDLAGRWTVVRRACF